MRKLLRGLRGVLCCDECGGEISPGESYWQVNGEMICAVCLPDFAKAELEPFRRVRGEEERI